MTMDRGRIIIFPQADNATLIAIAIVFFLLLVCAIVYEVLRRRRQERLRAGAEKRTVAHIVEEKELSEEESALVQDMIRRWSPREPLHLLTVRKHFGACAERELARVRTTGDAAAYEKMGLRLWDLRGRLGLDYVPLGKQIFSTRDLYLGQVIELSNQGGDAGPWVKMRVAALDEAFLHLVPLEGTKQTPNLRHDAPLHCHLWREEDGRYTFTLQLERAGSAPPVWLFHHSSELARTQTREHFRIAHDQTTNVELLTAPTREDEANLHLAEPVAAIRGRITSISAGGMALVLHQALPKRVFLRVHLELARVGEVSAEAHIVSAAPLSGGHLLVRCEWIALDEDRADKIARYVILRQKAHLGASEQVNA